MDRSFPEDPTVPDERMVRSPGGPPPPAAPQGGGYAPMLQGSNPTSQWLAAEGVQPLPPPPPVQLYANYQTPPPPPPPAASVAVAYPMSAPQTCSPEGYGGYGGYGPSPAPSHARQAAKKLAHTAGHSFLRGCRWGALGAAAAAALLMFATGAGAAAGTEGDPGGVGVGALVGATVGGASIIHRLMNRGETGGNTAASTVEPGTISGFRHQGISIDKSNIGAQQRTHEAGGGTASFTGSTPTLNGLNGNDQTRDRQVNSIRSVATSAIVAPPAPVAAGEVPTAAPAQAPTRSGQDVYRGLIRQMADAKPAQPREGLHAEQTVDHWRCKEPLNNWLR